MAQKHSAAVREEALRMATGADGELGWLEVLKLGLQYAVTKKGPKGKVILPEHKDMNIAIDCAKELEKIAMPRLSTKSVDDAPKKKQSLVVPDVRSLLPEGTEEL